MFYEIMNFIKLILLLNSSLQTIEGTILTSVSFVFETFSPYGLIRFFEFNDKDWNISENCLQDMYTYLEGLKDGSLWAVKLYDASSYYSGGIYGGYNYKIHNPDICRNLQQEYLNSLRMHWNLKTNTTSIPFPVKILSAKYEIELTTDFDNFQKLDQMICFPKSCTYKDLNQIMPAVTTMGNEIVKNMSFVSVREIGELYNFLDESSFYILIALVCLIFILIVCAHFSNYWILTDEFEYATKGKKIIPRKPKPILSQPLKSASPSSNEITNIELESAIEQISKLSDSDENSMKKFNMHPLADSMTINNINTNNHVNLVKVKKVKTKNVATISLDIIAGNCENVKPTKKFNFEKDNLTKDLLNCFSFKQNFDGLTRRNFEEEEVAAVRGLQVFCTVFMILVNCFTTMEFISNNKNFSDGIVLQFLRAIRKHSTYLIDMFFFLSGATLCHLYFKTSCKLGSTHVFEQLLHFLGMIAHKICSIILTYTIILICLELSSKYFYDNTVLEVPSLDYINCDLNKWKNVLFIDTFFPLEERCMIWSWFISLEVQFFVVGCLILLLAQIHPRYAGAICTTLFLCSILASTVLEMEPPITIFYHNSLEKDLMNFNMIFDKIWLRISPYLLGMCLGYILYKTQGKFEMNIFVIALGWIACFLIFVAFVFGFQLIVFRINPWIRAGVITLAHTVWSMILCWIILASISQYGGILRDILVSKLFFTMGKLTNTALLLNPLIIRFVLLNGESGIYLSGGQLITMFLGFSISTYLIALILHVLFEAPLIAALRVVYQKQFH